MRRLLIIASVIIAAFIGNKIRAADVAKNAPATRPSTAPKIKVGGNPILWHEAPSLPKLSSGLSDADYAAAVSALNLPWTFDIEAARHRKLMTIVLTTVLPDCSADRSGLKIGDVVAAIEGDVVPYEWDLRLRTWQEHDHMLAIISPGQQLRPMKTSLCAGVGFMTRWDGEAAWARSDARNPKFDSFIRVAAAAVDRNPDLALEALARAQRAGWDGQNAGYVPLALATNAFNNKCNFPRVLKFGAMAIKNMPDEERGLFVFRMRRAAIATFKLHYWLDLANKASNARDESELTPLVKQAIEFWDKGDDRVHPDPEDDVDNYDFRDATKDAESILKGDKDGSRGDLLAKDLREHGHFSLSTPADFFRLLVMGPPGKNVDATIEFDASRESTAPNPTPRTIVIGLAEPDTANLGYPIGFFSGMTMYDVGKANFKLYTDDDYAFWPAHFEKLHHTVRIIALDRRIKIFLDGQCALYGPLQLPENNRQLLLKIATCGMNLHVHKLTWRIADGRKS